MQCDRWLCFSLLKYSKYDHMWCFKYLTGTAKILHTLLRYRSQQMLKVWIIEIASLKGALHSPSYSRSELKGRWWLMQNVEVMDRRSNHSIERYQFRIRFPISTSLILSLSRTVHKLFRLPAYSGYTWTLFTKRFAYSYMVRAWKLQWFTSRYVSTIQH
jgi:hypothetical protein